MFQSVSDLPILSGVLIMFGCIWLEFGVRGADPSWFIMEPASGVLEKPARRSPVLSDFSLLCGVMRKDSSRLSVKGK